MERVFRYGLTALACASFAGAGAAPVLAQSQDAGAAIDIQAYDVSGNSILTTDQIERAVYPYLGPGRTAADVEAARAALEAVYQKFGYQSVVVQLAEPTGEPGIVPLVVTEARIADVKVTGVDAETAAAVRRRVPGLAQGIVPNLKAAEGQLAAANRYAERQITPLVQPGQTPGTIDVELAVEEKSPLHATLAVTNDHNQGTRPLRLLATVRDSNLWHAGHQLSATYLVAPQDRQNLEVFAGSYLAPLGGRWSLGLSGYHSNSNIAALGGTNVLGNGYEVDFRASLALNSKIPDFYQSISFGLDYKNFVEKIRIPKVAEPIRTPIEYFALTGSYSIALDRKHDKINASLGFTVGLRGIGPETVVVAGVPTPIFGNKRGLLGAKPNFVHVNADIDATHSFANDIQLFGRISAQYSDGPLVSNEQFAAGGLDTVRGYFQSEGVGDRGFAGGVELRSPSFGQKLADFVDEWRVYGFVDGAMLGTLSPGEGVDGSPALVSAGVGTRIQLFNILTGEAVVAYPIKRSLRGSGPFAAFSIKADY